jgi:hypothetical protein
MPKNTIRDILPPERRKRPKPAPKKTEVNAPKPKVTEVPKNVDYNIEDNEGGMTGRIIKIAFIFAFLVAVTIGITSFAFSGAKISISPKIETITLGGTFSAYLDPQPGQLQMEMMTLETQGSKTVPTTGKEYIETKASGTITIYNDHKDSNQRLIRNTRFESPDGLVYRIDESIVVPGQYIEDGEVIPGSVEAVVYADEPDGKYNIGLTEFTIPGFKGSPQFENFYAQSDTPMSGGFAGDRLTVEDSVLIDTQKTLRNELQTKLLDKALAEKPERFLLFEDALFISFESQPTEEESGEALVTEKATLFGLLFDENTFAAHMAQNASANYDGEVVRFMDPESLTLQSNNAKDNEPWKSGSFDFSVSGSGDIVWILDHSALREDITGRNKDALHVILSGYPSIDQAEAIIRPFWKGSFPNDPEKIRIEETIKK